VANCHKPEERLRYENHGMTVSLSTFMYVKTIHDEMHLLQNRP